jgi:hypothetical protein
VEHSYPRDLALFLCTQWNESYSLPEGHQEIDTDPADPLPDIAILETLISVCYQASLLREEERPIRFRLILRDPERFPAEQGPPTGLHRLVFTQPRPLNEHELRRLSPAVEFYRSLVGVALDPERGLQIWGIIYSGPRWVQTIHGGRGTSQPLPMSLVLRVTGPGRIAVCKGSITVATLNGGRVARPSLDVFDSHWLPASFAEVRAEIWALHTVAREKANAPWAPLDPDFPKILAQHVIRRMITIIRTLHHGGTLLLLPPHRTAEFFCENHYLAIKYKFVEEEPRQRFRTLIVGLMNALAEAYGLYGHQRNSVGWLEFVGSRNDTLSRLDEALFEVAHLIAGLSAIDGAVVLTKRFEVLGFGGEISGELAPVLTVARALDAEGEQVEREFTNGVGTRHRSVYRLCNAIHDAVAIVVSQDGNVRFVTWKDGAVTYWDQVATSVLDI